MNFSGIDFDEDREHSEYDKGMFHSWACSDNSESLENNSETKLNLPDWNVIRPEDYQGQYVPVLAAMNWLNITGDQVRELVSKNILKCQIVVSTLVLDVKQFQNDLEKLQARIQEYFKNQNLQWTWTQDFDGTWLYNAVDYSELYAKLQETFIIGDNDKSGQVFKIEYYVDNKLWKVKEIYSNKVSRKTSEIQSLVEYDVWEIFNKEQTIMKND